MVAPKQSQSVSEFGLHYARTFARMDETGEAEVLTEDGQPRAVLLSPDAYEQLVADAELAQDFASIARSQADYAAGRFRPAEEFFDELQAKLAAMAGK